MELNIKQKKLIEDQYWELYNTLDLQLTNEAKKVILPQTVCGRANEGHGFFRGQKISGIQISDVVSSIRGINLEGILLIRQNMVDEFIWSIGNLMDGKINQLVNKKGQPIYGVSFLSDLPIENDKEAFKGAVIIGRMDSHIWREKTTKKFKTTLKGKPFKIGYGKEYLINLKKLEPLGLNPHNLSKEAHSKKTIQDYRKKGIIVQKKRKGIETVFIRHKQGLGICDDMAITSLGFLHGEPAMILGWCIDATDTYSKFIKYPVEGGADEWIGEYTAKRWHKKYHEELVTPEECMEIIYLGAKNNVPISFSSSHRRFTEKEPGANTATFLEHLNFVRTGRFNPNYHLGFEQIPSRKFYNNIKRRFELYGKINLIPKNN